MDDFQAAGGDVLDEGLMAFAARRREVREARDAELEASIAAQSAAKSGAEVEFVQVVTGAADAEKATVEVLDAAPADKPAVNASPGVREQPTASALEPDDYAVRRVQELSDMLAAAAPDEISDEIKREAGDARTINIKAQESAKKAREASAAKPAAKKTATAAKATDTDAKKPAVKQSQ